MKNLLFVLLLALICMASVMQARRTFNNLARSSEDAPERKPLTKPAVNNGEIEEEEEEEQLEAQPLLVVSSTQDQTANPKEVESTIPCEIKQGYLVQVTKVDVPTKIKASDEVETQILHGRPVFVVLNKHTLSFFENENVNSLITSLNVKTLALPAIVESFSKYNCFQLNESASANLENEGQSPLVIKSFDQGAKFTFCTSNQQKMLDWAQAIIDFDNCEVEISTPAKDLTLQEQLDKKQQDLIAESQAQTKECVEAHEAEASTNEKLEEQNALERQQFNATVTELEQIITKSQQLAMKTKLEAEEQQRKLAEQTEVLQKEKICLEKMLMAKAQAEEAQTELLIKDEQANAEKTIFERTTEMFKKAKDEEAHKLMEQQEALRLEEEAKQAELKQAMVTETLRAELDQNYEACYDDQLGLDFVAYSKNTCYEMSKAEGTFNGDSARILSDCLSEETFCQTCCNFHIGLIHVQKRNSCQQECNSKLHAGATDTGIKVQADAIEVRIPRAQSLTALENAVPGEDVASPNELRFRQLNKSVIGMRFRQKATQEEINDQIKNEKTQVQHEENEAHKAYNAKQLQIWRDNLQAAKQKKVDQEYAAKVKEAAQKKAADHLAQRLAKLNLSPTIEQAKKQLLKEQKEEAKQMKFRETSIIDFLKKPQLQADPRYQYSKQIFGRFKEVTNLKTGKNYRFAQKSPLNNIQNIKVHYKPQTEEDREYNTEQLKLWRANLTQAKKDKEVKENAARILHEKMVAINQKAEAKLAEKESKAKAKANEKSTKPVAEKGAKSTNQLKLATTPKTSTEEFQQHTEELADKHAHLHQGKGNQDKKPLTDRQLARKIEKDRKDAQGI